MGDKIKKLAHVTTILLQGRDYTRGSTLIDLKIRPSLEHINLKLPGAIRFLAVLHPHCSLADKATSPVHHCIQQSSKSELCCQ